MDTDLTSIATFGWYHSEAVTEELTPISTFGWFLDFAAANLGDPDIFRITLALCRENNFIFER